MPATPDAPTATSGVASLAGEDEVLLIAFAQHGSSTNYIFKATFLPYCRGREIPPLMLEKSENTHTIVITHNTLR